LDAKPGSLNRHDARGGGRRLRVASSPASSHPNPYVGMFYAALRPHGVDLVGECGNTDEWLRAHADEVDVVHLHWPENRWRYGRRYQGGVLRGVVGLWRWLRLARRLGIRVMWTVHNLEAHEGAGAADRMAYRILARRADLLICHSRWAAQEARRRWRPKASVVVMYHGNYDGVYPQPRPRRTVLEEWRLTADRPMVCCVGGLRRYKGLDLAVRALRETPDIQLIIGGKPHADYDLGRLKTLIGDCPHIRLAGRVLSQQELSDVLSASEAVLLPYRRITGSGALMTAATFGRGVVASRLPYFEEMLQGRPDAGRLFNADDHRDLRAKTGEYLRVPRQTRTAAARSIADQCAWAKTIQLVAQGLRRACGRD
jgi:glycosyltransferase involved in cell wall biosynthesis